MLRGQGTGKLNRGWLDVGNKGQGVGDRCSVLSCRMLIGPPHMALKPFFNIFDTCQKPPSVLLLACHAARPLDRRSCHDPPIRKGVFHHRCLRLSVSLLTHGWFIRSLGRLVYI